MAPAARPGGTTSGRRERWGIVGAILAGIDAEAGYGNGARLTPLASRANIAYGRLREYLDHLEAIGLIADPSAPRITPLGREFLAEYRRWLATLRAYGLADAEDAPPPPAPRPPRSGGILGVLVGTILLATLLVPSGETGALGPLLAFF